MKKTLTKIIKSNTFKQSGVTLVGTFINGILGVIFYIYVARTLGPHDYGIFSFVTVTVALIASIANAGTDTGITKFVAKYYSTDRSKALRFLKEGLLLKLLGWFIVFSIGMLLSSFVAHDLLKKDELLWPLRVALFGVLGSMLFSFGTSALQGLQKFIIWSVVNAGGNAIRLLTVVIFVAIASFSLEISIWIFILIPLAGFLFSLYFLPWFINKPIKKSDYQELFQFNKWVALTTIIVALSSRLDSILSARYLDLTQVGFYSVAVSLSGFISQIVMALGTVAAPKFASFTSLQEAKKYFYKFETLVIGLSIIGVPVGIFISYFFVPVVYGVQFSPAISPLIILIIAYSLFLLVMPVNDMILYYFSNSRLFVYIAAIDVVITFVGGALLIPLLGMNGAALSVLITNFVSLVIPVIYIYRKLKVNE